MMQILELKVSFLLENMRKPETLKDVAKIQFHWISFEYINVGGEQ